MTNLATRIVEQAEYMEKTQELLETSDKMDMWGMCMEMAYSYPNDWKIVYEAVFNMIEFEKGSKK